MEPKENISARSKTKLLSKVFVRFAMTTVILATVIFVPAGSFGFWNGWLYLAALLIPMLCVLPSLLIKDPELLEKRIKMKEKETAQKKYLRLSIALLLVVFIVPGLDYRFEWSHVPLWLVIIATAIMISGYLMFVLVMKQNSYASRVIEIQEGQKVIDYGLYAVVRHPMYLAGLILYGVAPLVLGSFYAMIPVIFLPILLAYRIKHEEKVLREGLKGYEEYMKKVKYRLIPFIW